MKFLIPLFFLLIYSCEDKVTDPETAEKSSLLFISSEGNFGAGDGSIEVFRGDSSLQTIYNVGDVVQSIIIYDLYE